MNLRKLRAKFVEQGVNVETMAEILGIDRSTMYRKLNNFEKITIGEAKRLKEVLSLTDEEASEIFLN